MKNYKRANQLICVLSLFSLFIPISSAGGYYHYKKGPIATLPEPTNDRCINSLALSPDGTKLLTGDSSSTILLWNIASGEVIRTYKINQLIPDSFSENPVNAISFSPDGKKFIAAYKGYHNLPCTGNLAILWDVETGKVLLTISGHKEYINSAEFSPDGTKVATCGGSPETNTKDKTAKIWDATTGKEMLTLQGHTTGVLTLAFSADSSKLLTGGYDHSAILWDLNTGLQIQKYTNIDCDIHKVAISPDGKKVVTLGQGKFPFILWDAAAGQPLKTLNSNANDDLFHSVLFSSSGKILALSGLYSNLKLWDTEAGHKIHSYKCLSTFPAYNQIILSHDESKIIAATPSAVILWDAVSEKYWKTLGGHSDMITCLSYSPDGLFVISGSDDSTAVLWDIKNHKEMHRLAGHTNSIYAVSFSPDGKKVVTSSYDKTAKIWDVATGKELLALKKNKSVIVSMAFSKDGNKLLTGSSDGIAILWDVNSGASIASYKQHTQDIQYIAFSADESNILSGSLDKTVKLWDAATGKMLYDFSVCNTVSFSPDKTEIFTTAGGNIVNVWDSTNGQFLRTFTFGPSNYDFSSNMPCHISNQLLFSPDGRIMFIGRYNLFVDSQTGAYAGFIYPVNYEGIDTAVFSPDNATILCGNSRRWTQSKYILRIYEIPFTKSSTQYTLNTDTIYSASISPDGLKVLSGETIGSTVQFTLQNISTDQIVCNFTAPSTQLEYAKLSPDGSKIVVAYYWGTGTIVFDAKTGKERYRLDSDPANDHISPTFSGNGEKLITRNTKDSSASVWDGNTGALLTTFSVHPLADIITLALSLDGSLAVTGGTDKTVTVWDVNTSQILNEFKDNRDTITHVFISPDSKNIISYDHQFYSLWDGSSAAKNPSPRHIMNNYGSYNNMYFTNNADFIFFDSISTAPGVIVTLYDFKNDREIQSFQGEFLALSQDDKTLVTKNGQDVIVWDIHEYLQNDDPVAGIQDWSIF